MLCSISRVMLALMLWKRPEVYSFSPEMELSMAKEDRASMASSMTLENRSTILTLSLGPGCTFAFMKTPPLALIIPWIPV